MLTNIVHSKITCFKKINIILKNYPIEGCQFDLYVYNYIQVYFVRIQKVNITCINRSSVIRFINQLI